MRSASIRSRVIAAVVGLTMVALLVSGLVIVVRGNAATLERVAADQYRAVSALEDLARSGDPSTGQSYDSADSLLRATIRNTVTAPSEGIMGVVDGRVRWLAADGVTLRLENDPELVDLALSLAGGDVVVTGQVTTARHHYFYTVAPVLIDGAGASGNALVLATDLSQEGAPLRELYLTYAVVAGVSLGGVAFLIWLLVGRLLRPIQRMNRTAARISETDLGERIPVTGQDDLSGLAVTINGMLDRLQRAVDGQRRLLDDVGHELRTPLTIIGGHLELLDVADPEDVTATRDLVIDETRRMRRLVDDLLTLARSEQPDFVSPGACDVARLTDEAVAKAAVLGRRHWVLTGLADVEAPLDGQRITQAWLQLAANAVQYSADGSTISMGSRVAGGSLELWVADQGVGMKSEELTAVVGRRARGSSAVPGASTGLGLAIVEAIVKAHGGELRLASVPGEGTTATMVIPWRTVMEEQ